MALVIVMIAILVLGGLAVYMAYSMKVESRLAQTASDDQRLIWLGRSGVELASWVLAQEASIPGEPYDSLNQIWAGGSGSLGESNSPLVGIDLKNYEVGDGTVSLKIIDLERYANINTADSTLLNQALSLMGVDADSISVVSDSIQDWVSPGEVPRSAGAKSDYYQGFDPPYNCKDGPVNDMSELLLVKGIWDHPEIYWGGSATNHQLAQFQQHKLGFGAAPGQVPDYPFGLKDLFTPFSTGHININTADANVLQLLPGVDSATAASIIQMRSGPDGVDGTDDDQPFQNPGQISGAGVPAAVVGQISRYCTVRSSTFEVTVTAKIANTSRDYHAILFRNGNHIQVVSFFWDQ
jgi:general secretion pathway protein K